MRAAGVPQSPENDRGDTGGHAALIPPVSGLTALAVSEALTAGLCDRFLIPLASWAGLVAPGGIGRRKQCVCA